MKNVLVFFGKDKAKLLRIEDHEASIVRASSDGVMKTLPVTIHFLTCDDGSGGACWVAADRDVHINELVEAHKTLLLKTPASDKK